MTKISNKIKGPPSVLVLHPTKVKGKYQHFGEHCFLTPSHNPKMTTFWTKVKKKRQTLVLTFVHWTPLQGFGFGVRVKSKRGEAERVRTTWPVKKANKTCSLCIQRCEHAGSLVFKTQSAQDTEVHASTCIAVHRKDAKHNCFCNIK